MKRILLFVLTNIAVLVVLSITASVLGVDRFLTRQGLNLPALLGFAAVFGFGGSLISLAMSKWIAKSSVGAYVIEVPQNPTERWLVETVQRQAAAAGIGMPEVAIYDSPEINAFATGASRNNALVAVSTGLLSNMSPDEVEGVLAHEVSHVANGDMVTLALVQGVVNTFVIFLSRVVGFVVDRALSGNRDDEGGVGIGYFVTSLICEILFGFLASMIVMWFSRRREFRADAGGAHLAGRNRMIAALERLRQMHEPSHLPSQMAAFGINGGTVQRLFMTHPPLEERIAALRAA
ncbi:MAG TPA: protease HtpX [Plasticicumulans sp.]|uniref:protease HtpX n=1 Tax=Plasticicumulans sp. TaxID=2307179 RepID=UPI000FBC7682|nr:protease HtpX [Plasticicumulans sp.]MBS0603019.1 protease HtpX [Pseudomonadota bacterium]RTL00985.1 MAG: protease HtpX [Xanthomonadales bacterium]HMV40577.1 protease HtpX [Plasticicumulans sp.]HMW28314.1 protease HtpX [Plasticicumulans sp.]HMW42528.1 protease HtpX [Plasticicumulans sp.]